MDERLEHLLRKVAHLRALAANAGTQAEAESAAAQADAIIAKYRLSEADVEGHVPVEACEPQDLPLEEGTRTKSVWRQGLAHQLGKHYGCFVYRHLRRDGNRLVIVGRASDAAIMRLMYAWLIVEIERRTRLEHGRSHKESFRLGAVSGFLLALTESTRTEVEKASAGAAMVLASRFEQARVRAFAQGTVRITNPRLMAVRAAFERGAAAGTTLAKGSRQLPDGSRPLLISGTKKGNQ